jgi:hypothetical protein
METISANPEATALPLSKIFDGGWDVFTCDQMDEARVATILKNSNPPDNAPFESTLSGLEKAAREFVFINGDELCKAAEMV